MQTIVVDECHHLQNAWWKSLMTVVDALNPIVVALTATPPYDVSGAEWERYDQLCGAIDEEIGVPELVAAHNLCPHQDYIYFSQPTDDEQAQITSFREKLDDFLAFLQLNLGFKDLLKQHPYLNDPEANFEAIYQNPAYFSSIIVVLNYLGRVIPVEAIGIIGADETDIPPLNEQWLETFWNGAFKDPYFENLADHEDYKKVIQHLKKIGALSRGRLRLSSPEKLDKALRSSKSKLKSIEQIVQLEYDSLKEDLRMVILTDFIRKEALPKHELDTKPVDLIGVVPIFERIRRKFPLKIELGVLTGSLVIIPTFSEALFDEIVVENQLDFMDFSKKKLIHDVDYLIIEAKESAKDKMVHIVTTLFQRGGITVLVGTKSLLGEGWDAPAINALVLATVVGSFVYSNQMRGRAIRTLRHDATKTANIWHLVCVDHFNAHGGSDFNILKRRFRSFHGLSFDVQPLIQNGISRFDLPDFPLTNKNIEQLNQEMEIHAQNRPRLLNEWKTALETGVEMTEEIKIPIKRTKRYKKEHQLLVNQLHYDLDYEFEDMSKSLVYHVISSIILNLILFFSAPDLILDFAYLLLVFSFILGLLLRKKILKFLRIISLIRRIEHKIKSNDYSVFFAMISFIYSFIFLAIGGIQGIAFFLSMLLLFFIFWIGGHEFTIFKTWNLHKTHVDTKAFLQKIGRIILNTLNVLNIVKPKDKALKLQVKKDSDSESDLNLTLLNSTPKEEHVFMDSIQELMNPIDNPRYLLALDSKASKNDKVYYAVPTSVSKNKKAAELFLEFWKAELGDAELIFTRNIDGRHELLKARGQSFSLDSHPETERMSRWS